MSYQRVIPRDLFNESKLLKCLGRVCLLIHEGQAGKLTFEHEGDHFDIDQNPDSGGLNCTNLHFYIGDSIVFLESSYNSKDNYPLWFFGEDSYNYERVFNEDGSFTAEFKELIGV